MKQFFNPESLGTEYSKYIDSLLVQPKRVNCVEKSHLPVLVIVFACFEGVDEKSPNQINQPTTSNPVSQGRLCEKCDGKCVICDSYATWRLPECGLCLEFTQLWGIPINAKEFHEIFMSSRDLGGSKKTRSFSKSRLFVCNGLFQMKRAELQILIGTVPRDS